MTPSPSSKHALPPLSLYVHIPWCVRKCPYCDFNSHTSDQPLPESQYIQALIDDLKHDAKRVASRPLKSIFFGGGTPSLFSAQAIEKVIHAAQNIFSFAPNIEITLEANPGTAEYTDFKALKAAGVNRLSLGIQSFNDEHLKTLGRIHSSREALKAFCLAREGGIDNINLDLMHGLPHQTPAQAVSDIEQALALQPEHISWYQLTVEPNTVFYNSPPPLPNDDDLGDIQDAGEALLAQNGFGQYEVSAYALHNKQSLHNLNYWQFGDYIGIGAGAHSKITHDTGIIERYRKTRLPTDYLNNAKGLSCSNKSLVVGRSSITQDRLALEFMMNALRLVDGFKKPLFEARTHLPLSSIETTLNHLSQKGLMRQDNDQIRTTALGFRFLNTVLTEFDMADEHIEKTNSTKTKTSTYNRIASDKNHQ